MKSRFHLSGQGNPFAGSVGCNRDLGALQAERGDAGVESKERLRGEASCFAIIASVLVAAFLAMVFAVGREVRHSRELYRMSRTVMESEAQVLRLQELRRFEAVQDARVQAAFHRQQFGTQGTSPMKPAVEPRQFASRR